MNFQRFSKIYDHANTLLEPFPEGEVAQERIIKLKLHQLNAKSVSASSVI